MKASSTQRFEEALIAMYRGILKCSVGDCDGALMSATNPLHGAVGRIVTLRRAFYCIEDGLLNRSWSGADYVTSI